MVDVNVARLRAKLVELGATCRLDAERGVGYVLCDMARASADAVFSSKGATV